MRRFLFALALAILVCASPATRAQAPVPSSPSMGGPVTISVNASLTADLFCTDLTVNAGVTLTTNGFSIICTGTVTNNGTIETGLAANGGTGANESPTGATNGGAFPNSYGGSGGGGGGSAAVILGPAQISGSGGGSLALGGVGGTEFGGSCGTGGIGGAGSTPSVPALSSAVIQNWYSKGMSSFLAGAGGGGGAGSGVDCSNTGGAGGGSGAFGVYIQANRIIAGTIGAAGQNGGTGGSAGGGGGGGGVVLFAYGAGGYVPGTCDTGGGVGGAPGSNGAVGGNGGKGQLLTFNYGNGTSLQPVVTTVSISANPASISEAASTPPTIAVTVFDQNGFTMSGVTVNFSSTTGTLSAVTATTDENGQASVTLTLGFTSQAPITVSVSATAGTVTSSASVRFIPPTTITGNWMDSSALKVARISLPLGQYLSTTINTCVDVGLCQGTIVNANALPVANLYLITPPNLLSPNEPQFESALSTFLGINAIQHGGNTYSPVAVVILELPALQAFNALFNTSVQSLTPICFPAPDANLFPCIQPTSEGYVNLAFVISTTASKAELTSTLMSDFVSNLKADDAAEALKDDLESLLNFGDLSINVITTDLSQSGALNSKSLLDLYTLEEALMQLDGYVSKMQSLSGAAAQFITDVAAAPETGVSSVPAFVHGLQMAVTSLDIGVELLPETFDPSLQTNQLYQQFQTDLGIVTSFVDPPGATIMPSFFDAAGNLVLGYDANNDTIVYSSADGILFPDGNGFLALLAENPSNPSNYSEILNFVGTATAPMPYSIQVRSYDHSQPIQGYNGMLLSGTSVTIPIELNSTSGALLPQNFLNPAVITQQTGSAISVTATPLLSNGSPTTASNAFLILNGQQSTMTPQSSSAFGTTLNSDSFSAPTPFMVYMIAPGVPGGFTSGILGCGTGVHLVSTVQSLTLDSTTNQYVVVMSVANSGGTTAQDVKVTASLLNSATTATVLPIIVGNLGCEESEQVTLTFPASAGTSGGAAALRISETYTGGTGGGGFRITLPKD